MIAYPFRVLFTLSFLFINFFQEAFPGGFDTVATAGKNSVITFGALQQFVHERFYDRMYRTRPLEYAYTRALDDMIVEQLKRIDFFERGLDRDSALLESNRRVINEELVIRYFGREYVRKYVNDAAMREAYERMKREVVCRRNHVNAPAGDSAKSRKSFDAVRGQLASELARGATFNGLVSASGRLLHTLTAPVDTVTVTWKKGLVAEADSIIFKLRVGQIAILNLSASLEIVQIVRINTVPVAPYENVKDEIYNTLRERFASTAADDFTRATKALVDERALTWNEKALEMLLGWSNIPGFYASLYRDTLTAAIAEGRNPVLLNYRGGRVDLREYLRLLNDVLILPGRGRFRVDDLKKLILEALRTDRVVKKARALGLEKGIFSFRSTDPTLRDRIVSLYNQAVIEANIPKLTEGAIRGFYAANKDSLYYQLAKVNIYAVISTDRKEIDNVWQMHLRGTAFEKLAPQIDVKTFVRDRSGDSIRSYLSTETPFLGKAAFTLTLNQVAGPIEYVDPDRGTCYAIIKCVGIRPEKQLTMDDARKTIAADFMEFQKKKIGDETAESLKNKYGFKEYEDVLMRDVAALRAK